jgi:hypothetical protein
MMLIPAVGWNWFGKAFGALVRSCDRVKIQMCQEEDVSQNDMKMCEKN